jgi:hypothetical protein
MIKLEYDSDTGILKSTTIGMLTVADIDQSTPEIRAHLARAREKFGRARYLVDGRQGKVQPREVMEAVERDGSHLSHPRDKQAIVIPSALSAIQARRIFNNPNEQTFHSMDEAIAWLMAD